MVGTSPRRLACWLPTAARASEMVVQMFMGNDRERQSLPPDLSPERLLTMQHRFQRGLRFLRQVVGLAVVRKLVRNHVRFESQHRLRDQRGGISVASNEFRRMPKRQIDQVVEDEHLAVAIRAST